MEQKLTLHEKALRIMKADSNGRYPQAKNLTREAFLQQPESEAQKILIKYYTAYASRIRNNSHVIGVNTKLKYTSFQDFLENYEKFK